MEIFEERFSVAPEGLCAGELFRLIQRTSGDHCREIGYGESVMEEKGLMWVIVRHGVEVLRWPGPGEQIRICTWPGPTRHGMCPRWYRILDREGELLITGCAIWSVVDAHSRRMVSPGERGVNIEPLVTGLESPPPAAPRLLSGAGSRDYTVPPEVLDENGHMNNTRYYDLAEELLGTAGRPLRAALTKYTAESREGDLLHLDWGEEDGLICVSGENQRGPAFRMNLRY